MGDGFYLPSFMPFLGMYHCATPAPESTPPVPVKLSPKVTSAGAPIVFCFVALKSMEAAIFKRSESPNSF